jgi:hypothetical protein
MTGLNTCRRSCIACCTIAIIAVAGCAGAHAAKVRARTVKPAGSVRSDSTPHQIRSRPELKPVVDELMP